MSKAAQSQAFDTLLSAFAEWRGDVRAVRVARAPGRVNLIGDHTDYNEGWVLPATLDRAVYAAARLNGGTRHRVRSVHFDESLTFEVGTLPGGGPGHWASYVGGMLLEVRVEAAVDLMVHGDVPQGAGLSSSAALEMATGLVLTALSNMEISPMAMARIGQRVEHRYARVACGLMDQIVSRVGKSEHALLLDCRSLAYTHVPLHRTSIRFVLINSNVQRTLASSKYNERRRECADALAYLQAHAPELQALRDASTDLLDSVRAEMNPVLRGRARHVVEENARVQKAAKALRAGDWPKLGVLLTQAHESLRYFYEVSCGELDFLVDEALAVPGVYGARMMGGGFGGCTINVVEPDRARELAERVRASYREAFGREPTVWILDEGLEAAVLV